jgi:hypothetical protein
MERQLGQSREGTICCIGRLPNEDFQLQRTGILRPQKRGGEGSVEVQTNRARKMARNPQGRGAQDRPDTAEVDWEYGQTLDPYGVCPDLPDEYQQVGREYFARAPGSEVWVHFGDLPEETRDHLWARRGRELAFPAGLEGFPETLPF